ncbi:bifunctional DNA-formamidopyrimidine glycosylase/DNA-(apurinic or apyrimidinic site) lyase [Arvimicrobium flavum]|uniref:bifunctional DNA-formamidopyrimidine glycosylase/DNA-(apurinic or apyrimidinic site) lyase n=1 Tax=Arvimicrobium flavum TaxID=3393320 RepID=UPI00237B06B4|nr:bifunctional DNA-formamidopyrimidine glycosylase/DNA-(apurinic or apyrimidinic site) lyase [Mesorhizobium shangrilense]
MPELPEVETVRRGLEPVFEGAEIEKVELRRPDLRFPFPEDMAARLAGQKVVGIARRAKYLLLHTAGAPALICHLGMTGSFRIQNDTDAVAPGESHHPRSKDQLHDHVVFSLRTPKGEPARVVFNDPRRFGFMLFADPQGGHPMLDSLGVEPTGNVLDGALLASLFRGRAAPLKAALLDQRLIAGLGNIYVSEALWRAGLSPRRSAGTIASKSGASTQRAERLAQAVREVIADAIAAGGSSLKDYMHVDGSLGYFQHRFSVYDREGEACRTPGCGGVVHRIVQSGRSTFFCPTCQR